jgi:hypothetical protein
LPAGQPGVGDAFIKWIYDNLGREESVHRIGLTAAEGAHRFAEFPDHPELDEFDPSDEVFVAVASAHDEKPPILEASDSKWWGWKDGLLECGIEVEFLCPHEIEAVYRRKFGSAPA